MTEPAGNTGRRRRGDVLRGVGFALAVVLAGVAAWLIVTAPATNSMKRVEIGVLIGLWGLLLGAFSVFGTRRSHDLLNAPAGPAPSSEIELRRIGEIERAAVAAARREFQSDLYEMLRREFATSIASEVGQLRGEVAALRSELVDKAGGQLRLERTETTRLLVSDLEALQHELHELRQLRDYIGPDGRRGLAIERDDVRAAGISVERVDVPGAAPVQPEPPALPEAARVAAPEMAAAAPVAAQPASVAAAQPAPAQPAPAQPVDQPEPVQPSEPAPPAAAQTEPAQPAAQPETAQSEPAQPEPVKAAVQPETAQSEPAQAAAQPETAQPESAQPERVQPETAQPETAQPEPAQPEPAQPEPVKAAAQPERVQPQPAAKPEPSQDPFAGLPRLSRFSPVESEPSPGTAAANGTKPAEPASTDTDSSDTDSTDTDSTDDSRKLVRPGGGRRRRASDSDNDLLARILARERADR